MKLGNDLYFALAQLNLSGSDLSKHVGSELGVEYFYVVPLLALINLINNECEVTKYQTWL